MFSSSGKIIFLFFLRIFFKYNFHLIVLIRLNAKRYSLNVKYILIYLISIFVIFPENIIKKKLSGSYECLINLFFLYREYFQYFLISKKLDSLSLSFSLLYFLNSGKFFKPIAIVSEREFDFIYAQLIKSFNFFKVC